MGEPRDKTPVAEMPGILKGREGKGKAAKALQTAPETAPETAQKRRTGKAAHKVTALAVAKSAIAQAGRLTCKPQSRNGRRLPSKRHA